VFRSSVSRGTGGGMSGGTMIQFWCNDPFTIAQIAHFKIVCRTCNTIVAQCRCPDAKEVHYVEQCDMCPINKDKKVVIH
jgi:hypothetical protein